MTAWIENLFRASDHYRAYANVVGAVSLMSITFVLMPNVGSAIVSRIHLPDFGGNENLIAWWFIFVCLCVFLGTIIRLCSYLIEEILGAISPRYGYSYYYKEVRPLIEHEYNKVFNNIAFMKANDVVSTVDLVNSLKSYYIDFDREQYNLVKRHMFTVEILRNAIGFLTIVIIYYTYQSVTGPMDARIALIVVLAAAVLLGLLIRQFPRRIKKVVRNEIVLINSAGKKRAEQHGAAI